MKLNKKIILIALTFIFSASLSFSQNDGSGNTGLAFLKLGVGARSVAMGEAFSSVSEDATAYIYNPAMLNFSEKTNIYLSHNVGLFDQKNTFIGAKVNMNKLNLGFGLLRSGVDDIEVRLTPGAAIDKFDSQNLSLGLSGSYEVYKNLSFGVTAKFLYEKIFTDEATGFALDLGTSYRQNNLTFGFVVANIGSMNELNKVSTKIPTLVRFGGSYKKNMDKFSFVIAADGFKVLDGGKFHLHSGIEGGYKDLLFVRAGYQTNYDNKGFSAGIGFKYMGITLDYALVPYYDTFGTGNTISLGYIF